MADAGKIIRVGVLGAGGRMGQAVIAGVAADKRLKLSGAIERAGHPSVGTKLGGGLIICSNPAPLAHASDVLVDFTSPAALPATLDAVCDSHAALLIGTTGLSPADHKAIDRAAKSVAILQAANTSLGVTLLARLVEQAAASLGPEWDIEIAELHHGEKVDAPSGTALALGEAAAMGRGVALDTLRAPVRHGTGRPRVAGHIGFASMRGGSAAGDHLVMFLGQGERLELGHKAESRDVFARGAVHAAAWLAGKPAGRYTMADVLGV